jgi:S-methylmethionine-dependent homocysteine/selenocysteine methylase
VGLWYFFGGSRKEVRDVLTPALLDRHDLVLMEAAVVERLRRDPEIELHPRLVHAALPLHARGREALLGIYREYVGVARRARVPILLCSPTWRANRERIGESGITADLNGVGVRLLTDLRDDSGSSGPSILVGGLIGCKNDCYRPDEGLTADQSESFHAWQIERLARAGVDFLVAETLPTVGEAVGIATAMGESDLPFLISFVIDREGRVLDGTPLVEAVDAVDAAATRRPLGFMVNCAHPGFLRAASQPRRLFDRLIGFQGNASSLDHADLDGSASLQADDLNSWGEDMLALNRRFGVRILGGCCGTGVDHLDYLVTRPTPGETWPPSR